MKTATILFCLLAACSQPREAPRAAVQVPPPDLRQKFPLQNQVSMQLVPDHVLGKSFMPGGNLAEYKHGAQQYRVFLIRADDAQKAAFLLVDWRNALSQPQYLANMGGFFGQDAGTPVYVFSKGPYVAGWVGLPQTDADRLARQFATRLN
ncbi:MAG TPA: hypothetical protein DEQ47_00445 [Solibacterales bacterium]|nr:hypothetical protein [Bryobacterales bacterium]